MCGMCVTAVCVRNNAGPETHSAEGSPADQLRQCDCVHSDRVTGDCVHRDSVPSDCVHNGSDCVTRRQCDIVTAICTVAV